MTYETILTKKQMSDRGKKGAKARWLPRATHEGILKIMDKELPCVVLEDGERLIAQASIFRAFGRINRGRKGDVDKNIPSFVDAKNLKHLLTDEILGVLSPVHYLNLSGKESIGFRAITIPTVCEIYLLGREKGILTPSQDVLANLSDMLIRNLSKVGIIGLVDEATGYQQVRQKDALAAYLNTVIGRELASWCKRFPDEFYANIYKLKRWPEFSTSKNKYSCVGNYTNDIIYSRIGKDVLDELKARTPDTSKESLHQWLTVDTGHPILSQHIYSIMGLQRLALIQGYGWHRFMEMVNGVYPIKEHALELAK